MAWPGLQNTKTTLCLASLELPSQREKIIAFLKSWDMHVVES